MEENKELKNNLEQDEQNVKEAEVTEAVENSEATETINNTDNEENKTPIDKDLQNIKKFTIIVMGIFVVIAVIIFSSEIIKGLWSAINSDEMEALRSDEEYNISELLEENT